MDAAAPSRRAGPRRYGRPLIPPNYVSLRDLQELRLREKAERRRRQEEEEAAARREAEAEQEERRIRKEAEAEDAARRAREEEERRRRRKEGEAAAAAATRVRDAAAAEMKGSSSSRAPFRYNERPRGGPRVVVVAHRPPPPRGEGSAVNSGGAGGRKGPGGDAADGTLGGGGGGKARDDGKGKASVGLIAGPGDPAEPATGGKPEENSKGDTSGCQGTALGTSSVLPGELAQADTASYRGSVKPEYKNKGKKGFHGRSTEAAMTGSLVEAVKASPPQVADSENKGKAGSNNQSAGKALADTTGEAAEDSPLQGVKSDNKWKKKNKPSGGRQAGAAPSSDWPNGRRDQLRPAAEGSRGRRNGNGQGAVWEAKSDGPGGKQPEVEGNVHSHPSAESSRSSSSSNRRRGSGQGMTRKENFDDFGEKQPVVEMRAHPHLAADSSSYRSSSGDQGMTRKAKSEDLGDKQPVGRSSGGQGMNQEAKSERFEEKQPVVEMRAAKTYRGQRPGGCSRVNAATRQPGSVWVPKAAAVPVRTEVGNIP